MYYFLKDSSCELAFWIAVNNRAFCPLLRFTHALPACMCVLGGPPTARHYNTAFAEYITRAHLNTPSIEFLENNLVRDRVHNKGNFQIGPRRVRNKGEFSRNSIDQAIRFGIIIREIIDQKHTLRLKINSWFSHRNISHCFPCSHSGGYQTHTRHNG